MDTVPAKQIVTRTKSADSWFGIDYNMNIYRGCCHRCIYCDSRSDCYRIADFDRVRKKENALMIIRDDLRRKVKTGVIGTGSMSDPYNPYEKKEGLTRHALELMSAYGFGVAVATKSDLVVRDIDVLKEIKEQMPVLIKITVTTAEDDLCRKIEPFAPPSSARFAAIESLAAAGIFTGVLMMPILPFINDTEENILSILKLAKAAGAKFVYPAMGMTLRQGNREYYYEQLDRLFPGVRQQHDKRYGTRYVNTSARAKQLWEVFAKTCEEYGLLYDMKAIIHAYKSGYENRQLSLF